ncbi:MAG: YafY family protein [Acidimicrobiales bacterium]
MATTGRALELLALLCARPQWQAAELCQRLEVPARTLRRDIERLRELGYPITSVTGPHGGYRLGAGGRLPPLVLDDDEAVAVAVALRHATAGSEAGVEVSALMALAKLDQVLSPELRERVGAVSETTVHLRGRALPPVPTELLVRLAGACRRPERVRFDYTDAQGRESARQTEPYRMVCTEFQWYLVAFDLGREGWRTFRIDRIASLRGTGATFVPRHDVPDAAEQVAAGVAVYAWPLQATVRLHCSAEQARRMVTPGDGVVEVDPAAGADGRTASLLRIGGDADWIARYLAGLDCDFDLLGPPEVRTALAHHAAALAARAGRLPPPA